MIWKILLITAFYLFGCIGGYFYKYHSNPRYKKYAGLTLVMPFIYVLILLIAPLHSLQKKHGGIKHTILLFMYILFRYGEFTHIIIAGTRKDCKKVVNNEERENQLILAARQLKELIIKDKIEQYVAA